MSLFKKLFLFVSFAFQSVVSAQAPFVDADSWRELQMSSYIKQFDKTITNQGFWGLAQWSMPVAHLDEIKKRQESIALCAPSEAIATQLDTLLSDIKEKEKALAPYFEEHNELNQQAQGLYFQWGIFKKGNDHPQALEAAYALDVFGSVQTFAATLLMAGFGKEVFASMAEGRPIDWKNSYRHYATQHSFEQKLYQPGASWGLIAAGNATFKDTYAWYGNEALLPLLQKATMHVVSDSVLQPVSTCLAVLGAGAWRAWQDWNILKGVYNNYTHLTGLFRLYGTLQQRLVAVARYVEQVQALCACAQQVPALAAHPTIKKAQRLMSTCQHDASVQKLFDLLASDTFRQEESWWYSRGNVLTAHKLLLENKQVITQLQQAAGLVDAFIAIAHLFHTQKDDAHTPWCYVQFIEADTPLVHITDGWLPLIAHPVSNSLFLGDADAAHMMLTGPNGGGKSSLLKMVGGVTTLAHAWGIVPARACIMTFFHGVMTSFDPKEDLSRGLSTFMAQKERLNACLERAQQTHEQQRVLFLLDEPYRGTIAAEADRRVYALGKAFTQQSQAMLLCATHLEMPTKLAEDTGIFTNKQMTIIDGAGDAPFKCLYRLADGPATWWFNDIDRRIAFIDWVHE